MGFSKTEIIRQLLDIQARIRGVVDGHAGSISHQFAGLDSNLRHEAGLLAALACEYGLLSELHQILGLGLLEDIDRALWHSASQKMRFADTNGRTLLGIAAFHGQTEIVQYLHEYRLAKINAADGEGNTALHQVACGDAAHWSQVSRGEEHEQVAKYLLAHGAEFQARNNHGKTALDQVRDITPLELVASLAGRYVLTDRQLAVWQSSRVRPVFAAVAAGQTWHNRLPTDSLLKKPEGFEQFCLLHAIALYICTNRFGFGYKAAEAIIVSLKKVPPAQCKYFLSVVEACAVYPLEDCIRKEKSDIRRQSLLAGVLCAAALLYVTQNPFRAMAVGVLFANAVCFPREYIACSRHREQAKGRAERAETLTAGAGIFFRPCSLNFRRSRKCHDLAKIVSFPG